MTTYHRRRDGRPDFRRAAGSPCRFILVDFGTGIMPFDFLHSSLREFLGPCVETREGFVDDLTESSSSMASKKAIRLESQGCVQTAYRPGAVESSGGVDLSKDVLCIRQTKKMQLV